MFPHVSQEQKLQQLVALQQHRVPPGGTALEFLKGNCCTFAYDLPLIPGKEPGYFALTLDANLNELYPEASRLLGHPSLPKYSVAGLSALLGLDGLVRLEPGQPLPGRPGWIVLAYVAPGEDFHFLRVVGPDEYYHKPGTQEVQRYRGPLSTLGCTSSGVPYVAVGAFWYNPALRGTPAPGARARAQALLSLLS